MSGNSYETDSKQSKNRTHIAQAEHWIEKVKKRKDMDEYDDELVHDSFFNNINRNENKCFLACARIDI